MYERFNNEVRDVVGHANLAATSRGHQFMGCEHVLLGMLREGKCPAARVLKEAGVELESMEQEMDRLVRREAPGGCEREAAHDPTREESVDAINRSRQAAAS